MTATQTWNTTELVAADKAHHLHPVTNLKQHSEVGPLIMARGDGMYLWDTDGNRYMDAFAGLWNINVGHGRHELAVAAADQIDDVAFVPTFFGLASPPVIELSAKLASMLPGSLNHVHFTSGGAESNETSFKISRYYWWLKGKPEKVKIISRKMGYHGIAMGALAATGIPTYHEGFGPGMPGYVYVSAPYKYRNGEGMTDAEFVAALVKELEDTIAREGAETIAAFVGEPVQGAGGVVPPPAGYWDAVIEVLKRHDILLIADEVITGFGRTGSMFGSEEYNFVPDIMSMAKGITSGYIPVGATAVTDEVFNVMAEPDRVFMHGFTYSGHPVGAAVALRNIQIIEEENLPANARAMGDHLLSELNRVLGDHPNVGNIRGKGLMTLVELVQDRETKAKSDPSFNLGGKLTKATRDRGLIIRASDISVAMSPPLIIDKDQTTTLAETVAESINQVLG